MSNKKTNEFSGEILTPEIARKQIIEIGKVARTPPEVGIFDAPTRCFVVNEEWWAHIAGMVHWLADVTAWQDAEDEEYFAIREILKFMQGMECMEFQLRQSPSDSCILQQSLDGGTNWTDVFDFSLCEAINPATNPTTVSQQIITTVNNFQVNTYNNYVENYAGDITNIHPELGYGDNDDAYRDDALCYALGSLITSICSAALETIAEGEEVADDARTTLAIVGATLGILLLAGTGIGIPAAILLNASLAAAGIGLGAVVGAALWDYVSGKSAAVFEDEGAKEELRCILFYELRGENPNQAAIVATLEGVSGASSNAMDIAGFGAILLNELAYYAAFTETLAIAYQSAKLGLLPECPCADEFWMIHHDFSIGLGNWEITQGSLMADGVQQDVNGNVEVILNLPAKSGALDWEMTNGAIRARRISNGVSNGGFTRIFCYPVYPPSGTDVLNIISTNTNANDENACWSGLGDAGRGISNNDNRIGFKVDMGQTPLPGDVGRDLVLKELYIWGYANENGEKPDGSTWVARTHAGQGITCTQLFNGEYIPNP